MLNGLLAGGIYVLVAVGLTLIYGVLHIINFAHGSLLMLAMYAVFFLWRLLGIDPYVGAAAGDRPAPSPSASCSTALVIGRFSHGKDENILLITLGLSIVADNAALLFFGGDTQTIDVPYAGDVHRDRRGVPAAAQGHLLRGRAADLRRRSACSWREATPARRSARSPRSARARGWSASTSSTSSPSPTASASPAWAPRRAC